MRPGDEVLGLHVICFYPSWLELGAELLDQLPASDRAALKIRSGEHLAALVMSSFFRSTPTAVDRSGGVDLDFEVDAEQCAGLVPGGRQVVEVKSVGSEFRKFDAAIERGTLGAAHSIVIQSAADVMGDLAAPIARAAAKSVQTDADARHAFIIVHPFERLALESVETLIGGVLPAPDIPDTLDALWVLWFPDQLTVWSKLQGHWTQVVWDTVSEGADAPVDEDDERSAMERAEEQFLAGLTDPTSSPFRFRVAVDPTSSGPA